MPFAFQEFLLASARVRLVSTLWSFAGMLPRQRYVLRVRASSVDPQSRVNIERFIGIAATSFIVIKPNEPSRTREHCRERIEYGGLANGQSVAIPL